MTARASVAGGSLRWGAAVALPLTVAAYSVGTAGPAAAACAGFSGEPVCKVNGWTPVLPPVALWLPASGGLVAALLGGIAPAIRAGFVDPVEALAIDARQGVEMAVGADQAVPETGGREGELVAEGTDEAAGAPPPEAREDGAAATVPVAALRWVGEFAPVLIVGLVVRYWLISSRVPSWWQDSHDYLAASR
ncbi:MAG: hypothetical protein ACRDQW_06680, partial [Haloechinothrix sp.]